MSELRSSVLQNGLILSIVLLIFVTPVMALIRRSGVPLAQNEEKARHS
jgi:hypothetical protein